jgi:four helix bundle protein
MTKVQFPMTNEAELLAEAEQDHRDCVWWELEPEALVTNESVATPTRYDLAERTAFFGESVIRFAQRIPQSPVMNRLIDQLVGAGTSVGASYCEADEGISRKDFMHRIGICKKEARETQFFLRMVVTAQPSLKTDARVVWKEARELKLIFAAIFRQR